MQRVHVLAAFLNNVNKQRNMNQKEVWLPIKGYKNHYEISSFGRIKSIQRILIRKNGRKQTVKERFLKFRVGRYYNIKLRSNGVESTFNVHKLVAIAFLNHKPNGHELVVDHIDKNELNNNINNLQLITHAENLAR